MGLKDLAFGFGKVLAFTGALGATEAAAEGKTATDMQVAATYAGVESCGLYLREERLSEEAKGVQHPRSHWMSKLADCSNAQLQATLKEQEATLKEQEAAMTSLEADLADQDKTLAEANARLERQGLKIEDGKLYDLQGQLLGVFVSNNGELNLDLSPLKARTHLLEQEYQQALANFEQYLMDALQG